ncbi:hypothetical protein [Providencia sp. PROV247]|uniref:hypothetical protein n=1 Tax=Providencia sp. PROV247 TaxID=2949938 RepID=UPI00234B342D|nr:hypothetical protein [Providencia sp. PROV247]
MEMEIIEIKVTGEQPVKFKGKLVAQTTSKTIEMYETEKGHWVVVQKSFNTKKQGGKVIYIFTGYASEMKIIENKDINVLSKYIGYGRDLDKLCNDLGVDNAKYLDL